MSQSVLPAAAGGCAIALLAVIAAPLILFAGCQATRTPLAVPAIDLTDGVTDSFGALDTAAVPDQQWVPWVARAGQLCPDIPAALIAAQIDTESSWRPAVESAVGAQGLAQFMPATWTEVGRDEDGNGTASPFDPADAIMAQGHYMCDLVAQSREAITDGRLPGQDPVVMALAGYNAGFNRVLQYRGVPPFPETQAYVPKILSLTAGTYSTPGTINAGGGAATPSAPVGTVNAAILAAAMAYNGYPYVWAGGSLTGPTGTDVKDGRGPGFDCSGLVRYAVYRATGGTVELPRVSRDQGRAGPHMVPIPRDQAQAGDIIAFKFDDRNGASPTDWDHIGIISGPGQMFNAPTSGRNLGYADLTRPFYSEAAQQVFRVIA